MALEISLKEKEVKKILKKKKQIIDSLLGIYGELNKLLQLVELKDDEMYTELWLGRDYIKSLLTKLKKAHNRANLINTTLYNKKAGAKL